MGGFQAAVSKVGKIVRRVFAADAHLHMKIRRPRTFGLGGVDAIHLAHRLFVNKSACLDMEG
jgi:hypothetical protein